MSCLSWKIQSLVESCILPVAQHRYCMVCYWYHAIDLTILLRTIFFIEGSDCEIVNLHSVCQGVHNDLLPFRHFSLKHDCRKSIRSLVHTTSLSSVYRHTFCEVMGLSVAVQANCCRLIGLRLEMTKTAQQRSQVTTCMSSTTQ